MKTLITGATGNIGRAVIDSLYPCIGQLQLHAGVRNVEKSRQELSGYPAIELTRFDFEDSSSFGAAFQGVEMLFLLRPAQLADIEKTFKPLLESAKAQGIPKIVFLSVQGAELSKFIPHHKIENLIQRLGFDYIFVRPSYFMQNLTSSILPEIQSQRSITLPSADAKFNWIDVANIGEATAKLLLNFAQYRNQAYEITGSQNINYEEVAAMISAETGVTIKYRSINPIRFYFKKRREGLQSDFAIVMTILHFLPRFQKESKISDWYFRLTGKEPMTLRSFIQGEREVFFSKEIN